MRGYDVYGSSSGAYKVKHGSNNAEKIPGINGHVIHGIIADKFFHQEYNIYFTVKLGNCAFDYYALKDKETTAQKISGLPDDAQLYSIHNLAGVIFFGSSSGAYELTQGQLQASKISHVHGNVVTIKLNGSRRRYDAQFITASNYVNKCKYDLEVKKLQDELSKCRNEGKSNKDEANKLKQLLADQENKFNIERDMIRLDVLQEVITKFSSLDSEVFLRNIQKRKNEIKKKLNLTVESDEEVVDFDVRMNWN